MTTSPATDWSRRLAYVLRHDPASAGVTLDHAGWVLIEDLLNGLPGLGRDTLLAVVATDSNSRFTVRGDGPPVRGCARSLGGSVDDLA